MITGELKNKIDGLWDIFAAGGLVNPLEVIEQITYLMFIHDLDDSDNTRAKESAMLGLPYQSIFAEEVKIGDRVIEGTQLKWSVFHDYPADKMYTIMQEWVFPFIKTLHSDKNSAYSKYMDDAIFKLPTPLVLSKVVDSLDDIYKMMNEVQTADVRGDVYEYLLSKIAQSGRNGQFRTPRHIIRMMGELMNPSSDEVICDPACGTSGFLVASGEYLKEKKKDEIFFDRQKKDHYMNHMFYGYDMDRTMLRIGAMNMMTHGIDNPFIEYRDSLSDQNTDKDKYTLVLANPPFKGSLDAESVSGDLLKVCKTKKTELLFLTLFLRILKIGGRCACIVPDGVLFGSSKAHKSIRKEIVEKNQIQFPPRYRYEDVEFFYKLAPFIQKVGFVKMPLIHYIQRENSLSNHQNERTKEIFYVLDHVLEYYKKNHLYEEYKVELEYIYTRYLLCSSLKRMAKVEDKTIRKELLKETWNKLNTTFPEWKENEILNTQKTWKNRYIHSVNGITFKIYSWILGKI